MRRRYRSICLVAGLVATLLTACKTIDPVDNRAITINASVSDYMNESTLLNVLRAANREPLMFMTLSQVQGHNTLSGNFAVPTKVFGDGRTVAQKLTTFGPNSMSRSASNDFTMNVNDDKNTYASLYSPVTPESLSLLIAQGYPRETIFKLLVDHVRLWAPEDGAVGAAAKYRWFSFVNSTTPEAQQDARNIVLKNRAPGPLTVMAPAEYAAMAPKFNDVIDNLIQDGLTVEYRQPAGLLYMGQDGDYRICLDRQRNKLYTGKRLDTFKALDHLFNEESEAAIDCDVTEWATRQPPRRPSRSDGPRQGLAPAPCPSPYGDGSGPELILSSFRIALGNCVYVELYFRSVYGAYKFLGDFVQDGPRPADPDRIYTALGRKDFKDGDDRWSPLFEVERKKLRNGFVTIAYGGHDWSVAEDAINTKTTFAILHQLAQLYSGPVNAPGNTTTVRSTP